MQNLNNKNHSPAKSNNNVHSKELKNDVATKDIEELQHNVSISSEIDVFDNNSKYDDVYYLYFLYLK